MGPCGHSLPDIIQEIAKEDEEKQKRHLRKVVAKQERLKARPPRLGKHKYVVYIHLNKLYLIHGASVYAVIVLGGNRSDWRKFVAFCISFLHCPMLNTVILIVCTLQI